MKRLFKYPCFRKGDLTEAAEEIKNPARGWYRMFTFGAEMEPDLEGAESSLCGEDSLVLVLLDIGSFRDRDLDEEAEKRIRRILMFFAQKGYDCIVRGSYDHEGKALEREPLFFDQVLRHIRQLCEIIQSCGRAVFIYQGMLVGNWGEMHTSKFLSADRLIKMMEVLRTYGKEGTYLAVRRPLYWRMLHERRKEELPDNSKGTGLYDDGLFGSESDLGTFGVKRRKEASWAEAWCRRDELEFEREVGTLAPCGGETVYGGAYTEKLTSKQVLEDLYRMQITYLNRDYDQKVLAAWKLKRCPGGGVWAGKSLYDYVGAHLGYRFLIRNVRVTGQKDSTGKYSVEVEIENTGFGGLYQDAAFLLEYRDQAGIPGLAERIFQAGEFGSGEVKRIIFEAEAGYGALFLSAKRKRDGQRIFFANRADTEGRVELGYTVGVR